MNKQLKPPLGIMPDYLWAESHPDPSLSELLTRFIEVSAAVDRYRLAGLEPPQMWLFELGTHFTQH